MANEYTVNSADLAAVANAIRAKSGKSASLVFPDDFVAAIAGINVGVVPKVNLNKGAMYAPGSRAYYTPRTVAENSINFDYFGDSGCEQIVFPITGLATGYTYKLTFTETYNGGFIGDAYQYGCGIMPESDYKATTFPINGGKLSWITWTIAQTGTHGGNLTFEAASSTAYWLWNMSRCNDGTKHNITFTATIQAV